jgi:hypothetical protein
MGMLFLPSFLRIELVLSVIGISGPFSLLPFPLPCPLAIGTAAVLLIGAPWIRWLHAATSLASECLHGRGFLRRVALWDQNNDQKQSCAMGIQPNANIG